MSGRTGTSDASQTGLRPEATGARRIVLLTAGWACVGLGTVGVFLPVLPTTCFLLAAGACFARSSPRANHWLHHNRWFGRYLRDYREQRLIPMRVKLGSIAFLWITILATVIAVPNPWVRVSVLVVAAVVTAHVAGTASRRTCTAAGLAQDSPTG